VQQHLVGNFQQMEQTLHTPSPIHPDSRFGLSAPVRIHYPIQRRKAEKPFGPIPTALKSEPAHGRQVPLLPE
jgi:hypothetical protein